MAISRRSQTLSGSGAASSTPGSSPTMPMASASSAAAAVRPLPMASADVPLQMGTLSKAVGAYGGYLCASQAVIDLMRTRARTFIYSTGLPPPVVAAAIAALDLIERDPAYDRRAVAQGAALHPRAQSAGGAKRDRAGHRRRGRGGARGVGNVGRRKAFWSSRSGRRRCPPARRGCALLSRRSIRKAEIERLAGIVRTRVIGRHS